MSGQYWTEARIEMLKADVASGKTLSAISREWGVTKNTIIGKAQRLGLTAHHKGSSEDHEPYSPVSVQRQRRATTVRSSKFTAFSPPATQARPTSTGRSTKGLAASQDVNGRGGGADGVHRAPDAAQVETSITKAPGARLVPFLKIGPGECRFVVEEAPAIMCGADVHAPGSAWCLYHRALVYVPVPKRKAEIRRMNAVAVAASKGG